MQADPFQTELDELNDELKLSTYFDVGKTRPSLAEDWKHVFGDLTPKKFYQRFTKAAGEAPIRVQIIFPNEHSNDPITSDSPRMRITGSTGFTRIKIRHDSRMHWGHERENEIRFDIYPNKPPKLDGIFLRECDQSNNLAKRYLRTIVDLLKDVGADSIRLEAVEVGAYVWAKYGFTPETVNNWEKLKFQIKQRLGDDGTLRFDGHRYDASIEKPVIDKILATDFEDLPKSFPLLTELNREIGQHKGRPLTVGKALLLDTHWNGKLPLDEQSISFQRFNHYTDGATKDLQRRAI